MRWRSKTIPVSLGNKISNLHFIERRAIGLAGLMLVVKKAILRSQRIDGCIVGIGIERGPNGVGNGIHTNRDRIEKRGCAGCDCLAHSSSFHLSVWRPFWGYGATRYVYINPRKAIGWHNNPFGIYDQFVICLRTGKWWQLMWIGGNGPWKQLIVTAYYNANFMAANDSGRQWNWFNINVVLSQVGCNLIIPEGSGLVCGDVCRSPGEIRAGGGWQESLKQM